MTQPLGVYKKIHKVVSELRKEGIAKDRQASGSGINYKFRGIDDVYNALSGVLSEVGIIIIPKVVWSQSNLIPREGNRFSEHVILHSEFTMIDPEDGSSIIGSAYGEAIDTSDKAFGKAQSYAYKAFAFQAFCIPTEGDNDTENNNHDIAPPANTSQQKNQKQRAAPQDQIKAEPLPQIKEIRAISDVKTFLSYIEKLEVLKKQLSTIEFNEVWREYKAHGVRFNLEWDKSERGFITVYPAEPNTQKPEHKAQSATH